MADQTNRMRGRIQRVSIEGFRSLAKIENLELPQLTVLIGSNGAGKSNFIRFFEMLGWMFKSQKLQEYILRQGGGDDQFFMGARTTPIIRAEIRIETEPGFNDYRFSLMHVEAGDAVMVSEEAYRYSQKTSYGIMAPWNILAGPKSETQLFLARNVAGMGNAGKTANILTNLLRQFATYQFHDTSANANIRRAWDVTDYARMRSDGANLAPILLFLRENEPLRYRILLKQIHRVLPSFGEFELEPTYGKVMLRWRSRNGDKTFGPHLTSDGSLRLFCLLTLLSLPGEMLPDVLFLDEPELGLHPHAIILVAEMLKRVSQLRQVFIATQSPFLVDCFDLENIIVAGLKDNATTLRSLPPDEYQHWLDNDFLLSDIWLKTPVGAEL